MRNKPSASNGIIDTVIESAGSRRCFKYERYIMEKDTKRYLTRQKFVNSQTILKRKIPKFSILNSNARNCSELSFLILLIRILNHLFLIFLSIGKICGPDASCHKKNMIVSNILLAL